MSKRPVAMDLSPARIKRIRVVREAVEKVVKILSGKKIRVVQRGSQAAVQYDTHTLEPVCVYIPVIPDDATDDLIDAVQGFIDHEVAHLLYTDHMVGVEAQHLGPRYHFFWNALEDCFIERRVVKDFVGSSLNLNRTRRLFSERFIKPGYEQLLQNPNAKPIDFWNQLSVCAIRAWSGQQELKDFMDEGDKWRHIEDVTKSVAAHLPHMGSPKNSRECLELAVKLCNAVYGKPQPPEEQEQDQNEDEDGNESEQSQQGQGQGQGSGGKGQSVEAEFEEDPDETPDELELDDQQGDESSDADEAGDESDTDSAEQDDKDGDESDTEEDTQGDTSDEEGDEGEEDEAPSFGEEIADEGDEPEDAGDESESDENEAEGDSAEPGQDSAEQDEPEQMTEGEDTPQGLDPDSLGQDQPTPFSEDEFNPAQLDFDTATQNLVSQLAQQSHAISSYVPYSTEYDRIERFAPRVTQGSQVQEIDRVYREMEESLKNMVGTLQKSLERAFIAMNRERWETAQRRGRLNPGALSRLLSEDDRVFRRREEVKTKAVDVSLVIDCSGSMCGREIYTAMQTGWALAETLDRLHIPCEVLGFTTAGAPQELVNAFNQNKGGNYHRFDPLYMPIFKEFNERFGVEQKRRMVMATMGYLNMCGNTDGESIRYAADRLLRQNNPGKAMMVLSDGMPSAGDLQHLIAHLKQTTAAIEKQGVNLVGIGIHTDAPKQFYRKAITLHNIEDLAKTVIGELREALLQR